MREKEKEKERKRESEREIERDQGRAIPLCGQGNLLRAGEPERENMREGVRVKQFGQIPTSGMRI